WLGSGRGGRGGGGALVTASTFGSLADPELDAVLSSHRIADLIAAGLDPAVGSRMEGEQPALRYLYHHIGALNADLDRAALLGKPVALRTTAPSALAALRMPVLCVVGAEDAVIPPESVALFASRIPGARLARVPETGHSVYFERAAAFNRLLDDFLASTRDFVSDRKGT